MIRLNRKMEYALMALKVMAHKRTGAVTSTNEIVEQVGCPFDATARVLQQLAQRGILRSEHGAHGGYRLVRDLHKVSLFVLMETVLGPVAIAKCLVGPAKDGCAKSACDLSVTCNIMPPVAILNHRLQEFYRQVTLGELLAVPPRKFEVVGDPERAEPEVSP